MVSISSPHEVVMIERLRQPGGTLAGRNAARPSRNEWICARVGLALVVTGDGAIPLVSHAYPGDRPDVTRFTTVIDELVARYRDLTGGVESLTVVYDAGQNSHENH